MHAAFIVLWCWRMNWLGARVGHIFEESTLNGVQSVDEKFESHPPLAYVVIDSSRHHFLHCSVTYVPNFLAHVEVRHSRLVAVAR
jgi:hypothetical protein